MENNENKNNSDAEKIKNPNPAESSVTSKQNLINPSKQDNSIANTTPQQQGQVNGENLPKEKISKRRISRILAMELLFSMSFTKYNLNQAAELFQYLEDDEIPRNQITQFTIDLVAQTLRNIKVIDESLKGIIKNWKPERLSLIDRTLLRLGAAEVIFFQDIPPKVTINEYIEIAKDYSEDDAPGFINGILDRLARNNSKL